MLCGFVLSDEQIEQPGWAVFLLNGSKWSEQRVAIGWVWFALTRLLYNHGYYPLANWDDFPST